HHLKNYSKLYTNPLSVWRHVIGNRKSGYDLVVLHLIYYSIFLFFIVKDIKIAIPFTILEAAFTILPFLFFIVPFLFFVRVFKKAYKWDKLFRLFIILKLQFIPLFILLNLLNTVLKVEDIYLITDNIIWSLLISFIITFPLVSKIKIWQKILWLFGNYLFFLIASLAIYFLSSNVGTF